MMKTVQPTSVTVEEAVARLVNLAHIPPGFNLSDMMQAFVKDAEVTYHKAKVEKRSAQDLMRYALRVDICKVKLELASKLLVHIKLELENPEQSLLKASACSVNFVRLELKSVGDWAEENFGISLPDWSGKVTSETQSHEHLKWKDVTIKIYKDYRIGCFIGTEVRISAHFRDIDLMGVAKKSPNNLGIILIDMSRGGKYPAASSPKAKEKTAIAKIRRALKKFTGIKKDPFYNINESDGWRPKFTLADEQKNADLRAKKRAIRVDFNQGQRYNNINLDQDAYEDSAGYEERPYDDEDDMAAYWLKGNA